MEESFIARLRPGDCFVFAGRLPLSAAQARPHTFSMAVNDYGLELLCAQPVDWPALLPGVLSSGDGPDGLLAEVPASLHAGELARRRFREIARIAGLVFQSRPGEQRSSRQLQASASLFYEVFRCYDPDNRLLHQAEQELLRQELDVARLAQALRRAQAQRLALVALRKLSPLAFPLMVERFRERLSSESASVRIARMVAALEAAAGGEAVGTEHVPAREAFPVAAVQVDAAAGLELDSPPPPAPRPAGRRRMRRAGAGRA